MNFEELRAELAKNDKLKNFTLSGYDNAGGKDNNGLIQIYKQSWFPCLFKGVPLEIHFEVQSNKLIRLDCHWYPYYKFKNLSQPELIKKFPQIANHIEDRKNLIHKLSADAKAAYSNNSRIREVRFNALSGIEWKWDDSSNWQNIADEIAEIVTSVSPLIDGYFGKELNIF